MDVLNPSCAAQSVGPANQLFGLLVQTILAAQCAISPKDMWPKDYGPTAVEQGLNEPFDFIVVGAGSAGSVVASRLSENPNWKVLLLEAGGDPPIESEIPFMISSLQNTSVDWGYSLQKTQKVGNLLASNVSWPSGKFIGGSAGMDVRFYVRGNPRDFNEWEYAGNPNWNWQNMLQYFKKAENQQTEAVPQSNDGGAADESLGKMGPLPIESFVNEQPFKQTLFDAAQELGHKQIADLNGNEYIGIGRAPGIISQGKLYNAAKAYLSPIRNRTNLYVIKYAHVTKVNVDNTTGQVTGVQFQINQTQELTAVATKETILSAGSIGTPKILQLSGIGPEKYLTRLNISIVRNLYTGFSLQNHITVPLFIQFNVSDVQTTETNNNENANTDPITATTATTTEAGVDSTDTLYDYIKQRKDIAELQNIFDVLGFFSTINSPYPNIGTQYAIFKKNDGILLTEYLKVKIGLNESVAQPIIDANKNADIAIVFVTLLNPVTLGKVILSSADPYALPLIQSNYLSRPEDIATLVQGVQLARNFLQTTPFKELNASDVVLSIPDCETVPVKKKKVKPTKPPKEKSKKHDKKNKGQTSTTETPPPSAPLDEPLAEAIPFGSDQYFECYVKQVSKTHYQPVGTSKMGPLIDRFAVVDSRLKVHHLTGLRVVDASIMPKIISAPIDAATIAIAEKASDLIKEDWATAEATPAAAADAADATAAHEEL
ncbi:glucose dehydrogenase [FAD, quinone]-like isoform X1 [Contarinia nasturtii]|uniref:glucose dehydrogenase [FAD, quinone]-like isoform X1 n=1 Tax=Contarinia nasturtii TaxID=265458 RepID=UPI0012D42826|nr:glucose dehydrogenase [FAD, quinone]-like isoform X1 [Contarinia nasturtii]XP_031636374.1 glucose dehydrogenase [FAD, quinone]-like isoform X1 [Contarinia nasturtii]